MKSQSNNKCLYNEKSLKGIKIILLTVIGPAYKIVDYA